MSRPRFVLSVNTREDAMVHIKPTRIVAVGGKTSTGRRLQHEIVAILVLQRVGQRVEVEGSSEGQGNHEVGRGDECVGCRVGVVAAREVPIIA